MVIEIVSFPIKNGDFPELYVSLPEGMGFQWNCTLKLLPSQPAAWMGGTSRNPVPKPREIHSEPIKKKRDVRLFKNYPKSRKHA